VVDDVENRAGEREHRGLRDGARFGGGHRVQRDAQAHEHVADLADDVERQDPAHVVLRHRAEHAADHRQPAQ
jgi:hypothetical protein